MVTRPSYVLQAFRAWLLDEIDASRRALAAIEGGHLLETAELSGARKVLFAAAMTYVAAAVASLLQLLYFVLRYAALGGDRER